MERQLVFQRLVQRDMNEILRYYLDEAGEEVAGRFYHAFLQVADHALRNPEYYHPASDLLRRAPITGFPYHFLYRSTSHGIRILVLRHDRRHPSFGLRRM
jgi:plasmid stabilization system protein ParE